MAQVLDTDVLVVGGGGAGARAAWEANQVGVRVMLAVKGRFGAIGTRGSGATAGANSEVGGFRAPGVSPRFTNYKPEEMFADIRQAGLGMADPKLARILAEEAESTRITLDKLGITNNWNPGFGVKSHGVPIVIALENAIRRSDIVIKERTMVTDLLVRDGACVGAMALDEDGTVWAIKARAVILGTGGNGQLYMFTMDPSCVTGDGYAMGYEAGTELMNMEFGQTYIGSVYPTINLIPGVFTRYLNTVTNRHGHRFIADYLPPGATMDELIVQHLRHGPFSTRDSLSRYAAIAMIRETKSGHANQHNAFYLDARDPNLPLSASSLEYWAYRGLYPLREPLEVNLAEQCSHGGLRIDENAQTGVLGLYAAGEAGSGYHGADRMSGCMLACSQVFGARAGRHAAQMAKEKGPIEPNMDAVKAFEDRIEGVRRQSGHLKPGAATAMLQRAAWEDLLIARSEESLNRLMGTVHRVRNEVVPQIHVTTPLELQQALELRNLLLNGEIVASAALSRTESRGSHYREDYPLRDDANWIRVVTVRQVGGKMQVGSIALDPEWKSRPGDLGVDRWG